MHHTRKLRTSIEVENSLRTQILNQANTIRDFRKENKKLKALLIKAAETTHKCKELHDWYCEYKEND